MNFIFSILGKKQLLKGRYLKICIKNMRNLYAVQFYVSHQVITSRN